MKGKHHFILWGAVILVLAAGFFNWFGTYKPATGAAV